MRLCPYCKADVHEEAVKCQHCGSPFGEVVVPAKSDQVKYVVDKDLIRFAKFAVSVLALFIIVGAFLYGFDLRDAAKEIRTAQEQTRIDRIEIADLKSEVTKLRDEVRGLVDDAKQSVSTAYSQLQEIRQRVKTMEALAAKAESVSGKLEKHFQRIRSRLSTAEDILTTVEIRSRSTRPDTESAADTVLTDFYSRHRRSVVTVLFGRSGWASGVIVSDQGHIVTADYAIPNGITSTKVVTSDGNELDASLVKVDGSVGLAILKVDPFPSMGFLSLASHLPGLGTAVVAIGTGRERVLSSIEGSVSQVSDEWITVRFVEGVGGFGGGPVLSLDGKTIGIVYQRTAEQNTDQCKRSDAIKTFLKANGVRL